MKVILFSFGFKHALPEADSVFDVRFLPNPYYVQELSPGTGLDQDVAGYVLDNSAAEKFFQHFVPFILSFIQNHAEAERELLRVGIGCTGGRHRSVAVAEKIKMILEDNNVAVELFHRDIDKV